MQRHSTRPSRKLSRKEEEQSLFRPLILTPVVIAASGVVIRGANRQKTVIVPRFKGQELPSAFKAVKAFTFRPTSPSPTRPRS